MAPFVEDHSNFIFPGRRKSHASFSSWTNHSFCRTFHSDCFPALTKFSMSSVKTKHIESVSTRKKNIYTKINIKLTCIDELETLRLEKLIKEHDKFHENQLAQVQNSSPAMNRIFFYNFSIISCHLEDICFSYLPPIFEGDMFFVSVVATLCCQ